MTLKTALPELERISLEIFGQKLSGKNVMKAIRFHKLKKLKIKLNTK